ncbi:hypothetical protein CO2235_MP100005 [Cupriavidus oxalaticus]|uniref:Uncharacterized protein n=1 Tax=Cupriavidus oxalaticus TaxID=96344 RepID=A0A976BGU7_9BURK|nr:hypothetical protein CO2235_MP100005 [Cupriavidus oxalaticus]
MCTTTARPITPLAPVPTDNDGSSMLTRTLPLASAVTLFMSPAWCSGMVIWPCGLPPGLKWPPALIASGAEQSPFSWTWKPWTVLGGRPVIEAVISTPPGCCWKVTVPAVLVPLLGCSCAAARAPLVPAEVAAEAAVAPVALDEAEALLPEPAQPASTTVAATQAARGISTGFIGILFSS